MDNPYSEIVHQARTWMQKGVRTGWISERQAEAFDRIDERIPIPAALFDPDLQRPLVMAFFGGSGVGKSTLLNRLARQTIARTGIERPTSREATVYHHQTIPLDHLIKTFPIATIKVLNHREDAFKEILWVDMPDIDSIEAANRTQVLNWLPYIDVLIYAECRL